MKTALRVGLISSVVPKKCGIATFSRDLVEGMLVSDPDLEIMTVAAEEPNETYEYELPVCQHLKTNDHASYLAAAACLNDSDLDVVLLQHEFGLYGGARAKFKQKGVEHDDPTGDYILDLLAELDAPVITTLHTVLPQPDRQRRQVIRDIAKLSAFVVTMSKGTKRLLVERYGLSPTKVVVIPHGVPAIVRRSKLLARQSLGLNANNFYLTVTGLLGPNKGLDLIINALPDILDQHPNVRLLVVGQTHPGILAHRGETYREGLIKLAEELRVRESILFVNAYLSTNELMLYLRASDAYLTIHGDPEQAASGTLAYAVGTGLPTISTSYMYAKELLAGGRGILVPFDNTLAISRAVNRLIKNWPLRQSIIANIRRYGRTMAWPVVARSYLKLIEQKVLPKREHAVL